MHETVKHSNDHTFVAMDENLYDVVLQVELHHSCLCLSAEYSKRVYQGVRVKHTVKDLLAEKRSRQTSGPRYSVSATSSKLSLPALFSSITPNGTADVLIATGRFSKTKKLLLLFTLRLVFVR